jgi:hypothetical protein
MAAIGTETHRDSSLLEIIKDLRNDASTLFRQEVALAKREMVGKALSFGKNTALIGAGAVLGLYASFFLCFALSNLIRAGLLVAGFSAGVAAWFAPLILTMLLAIGGLLPVLKGLKAMRRANARPNQTLDSIREDKDWVKAKWKGGKR